MRSTVGNTWLFQYVLTFTLIFAAFLALAISYNRVFKVKNEMLSIIEKYEGVTNSSNDTAIGIINKYLKNSGYTNTGSCESDEVGVESLDYNKYDTGNQNNKRYYYCLKSETNNTNKNKKTITYSVKLFFRFELPVLNELFVFRINGKTEPIILYNENKQSIIK